MLIKSVENGANLVPPRDESYSLSTVPATVQLRAHHGTTGGAPELFRYVLVVLLPVWYVPRAEPVRVRRWLATRHLIHAAIPTTQGRCLDDAFGSLLLDPGTGTKL